MVFIVCWVMCCGLSFAQIHETKQEEVYKTPMAGESFHTVLFGRDIEVPSRDRSEVAAINLGVSLFAPSIADQYAIPFFSFYYLKHWEENHRRLRMVLSGVVNYIDFADGTWNSHGVELLLHWENFTIPFPSAEIVNGREVEYSEIYWGSLTGGVGIGWRSRVYPYQQENDLRFQFFYEPGFLYIGRSEKTGEDVILPPNTTTHTLHWIFRFDSMERNLLELPHRGWAFGADFSVTKRESWSDHQFGEKIKFYRKDTREYFRCTGYIACALDVPYMSERHRFLAYFHAGFEPSRKLDRFSSFRIGGGPLPTETNDLARYAFPGALFDQFLAGKFFILTFEYRWEILFFLYFHIRGTLAWGDIPTLNSEQGLITKQEFGGVFSTAITSGFLWDSVISVEYAYDDALTRYNKYGHTVLVSWSKEL